MSILALRERDGANIAAMTYSFARVGATTTIRAAATPRESVSCCARRADGSTGRGPTAGRPASRTPTSLRSPRTRAEPCSGPSRVRGLSDRPLRPTYALQVVQRRAPRNEIAGRDLLLSAPRHGYRGLPDPRRWRLRRISPTRLDANDAAE